MSQSDFERFRRLVAKDPALQEALLRTSDQKAFIALVINLSQEQGYALSVEDVQSALNAGQRSWLERLI